MSKPPLRHYRFTWNEVLDALQRRMHDADHQAGVSLLNNADHSRSSKPLFHRIRAGDTLVIDLFEDRPAEDDGVVLRLTLPKRTPPMKPDRA